MKPSSITSLLGLVAACLIYQLGKADNPPMVEHSAGKITVRFWTDSGKLYQLEASTNLVTWVPASPPAPGVDGYLGVTESTKAASKFYRLRQL